MLKKSMKEGPVKFDLFTNYEENILSILIVFVMFFTLLITVVYEMRHDMKFNKSIGGILAVIYFTFIIVATVIEFKRAFFS